MHERDPQALLTIYRESLLGIYASEDEFSLYLFLFFSFFLFFFTQVIINSKSKFISLFCNYKILKIPSHSPKINK